ncbi:hypothetical protein OIU84_006967 [Salix udensis]|uniref:Uncharacterized protein n=1 Tax=Salix udensis TaxID=889485 RepID=A0AAD6P305_9ROSI|nr:hypothetical protein OIU84_006967 [Salix udensis]
MYMHGIEISGDCQDRTRNIESSCPELPPGLIMWKDSESTDPTTRSKLARKYMSRSPASLAPATGKTPAPTETDCMCFSTATSLTLICLLTAKPTFLPLQYMDHTGTLKREQRSFWLSTRLGWQHPSAMRSNPCCISFAR